MKCQWRNPIASCETRPATRRSTHFSPPRFLAHALLDCVISPDRLHAYGLPPTPSTPGFAYLWTGVRATHGVRLVARRSSPPPAPPIATDSCLPAVDGAILPVPSHGGCCTGNNCSAGGRAGLAEGVWVCYGVRVEEVQGVPPQAAPIPPASRSTQPVPGTCSGQGMEGGSTSLGGDEAGPLAGSEEAACRVGFSGLHCDVGWLGVGHGSFCYDGSGTVSRWSGVRRAGGPGRDVGGWGQEWGNGRESEGRGPGVRRPEVRRHSHCHGGVCMNPMQHCHACVISARDLLR